MARRRRLELPGVRSPGISAQAERFAAGADFAMILAVKL
jgi:hypothetical protein